MSIYDIRVLRADRHWRELTRALESKLAEKMVEQERDWWTDELRDMLQPGKKIRFKSGAGKTKEIMYIRSIVDDDFIVYKVWRESKQYWNYKVESVQFFNFMREFLEPTK